MTNDRVPLWLEWAREIQALSQTGLTFSENDYNSQRYRRLMEIAAEMVQSSTGLPLESVLQSFNVQPGYATPKVDVRGAVVCGGSILLVQERSDHLWCMPGGWADVGEVPSQMVAREVWEESGFEVVARKMIGVFDANRDRDGGASEFFHAYKIVFLCDITGGAARPSDETLAVEFFDLEDLPQFSRKRTNERHLDEVVAHVQDPSRPAYFD